LQHENYEAIITALRIIINGRCQCSPVGLAFSVLHHHNNVHPNHPRHWRGPWSPPNELFIIN